MVHLRAERHLAYHRQVTIFNLGWFLFHLGTDELYRNMKKKKSFGRYLTDFSFSEPFKVGRASAHVSYNRFIFLDSTSEVL